MSQFGIFIERGCGLLPLWLRVGVGLRKVGSFVTEKSRIICVGTVVLCVSLILCSVINTSKLLLLRSLASWSVLCFYLIYGLSPNLSTLLPRAPFCTGNIFFK